MSLWGHLLSVHDGQTVLVSGVPEPARHALRDTGATPVDVASLPTSQSSFAPLRFDHGIVLVQRAQDAKVQEAARQIRPGGTFVLGLPSAWSRVGVVAATRRRLHKAGVQPQHAFWTGMPWTNPAWAVPVGVPSIAHWFVRDWYVPWSRRGALTAAAPHPLGTGPLRLLADGVAIVGRVHEESATQC